MSRQFLTGLNLNKNELLNARVQNLPTPPSNPVAGQIYFDTDLGTLRQYDGIRWLSYVSAENGSEFIQSVDSNFGVTSNQLSLANRIYVHSTIEVGGDGLDMGELVVRDSSGNISFKSQAYDSGYDLPSTVLQGVFKVQYPFGSYDAFSVDSGAAITNVRNILNATNNNGMPTIALNGNDGAVYFVNSYGDQTGWIASNGYNLDVVSSASNLTLKSNNGDIELRPDGMVRVYASVTTQGGYNITAGNNLYAGSAIYAGGPDWGNDGALVVYDANGNNGFYVGVNNGAASVEFHGHQALYAGANDGGTQYGQFNYDGGKNFILTANYNDLIIQTDSGYAYIGNNNDSSTRIATWGHVSAVASGLNVKESVLLASLDPIDLATWNAVGGYIDFNGAVQAGSRVLLLGQANAAENGIYLVQGDGSLARAADQLVPAQGDYVFVETGSSAARGFIVTNVNGGTGAVTWTQFSAAGEYVAGNGIDITGTSISVKLDSDSLSESGSGLKVNYHTDGGLDNDGGLYVKLGTGLTYDNSGNVAFASGYGVQKYAVNNPALTASSGNITWTITHGIGSSDVTVQLRSVSTNQLVEVDVEITDANTVNLYWVSDDVSANSYRVVIIG